MKRKQKDREEKKEGKNARGKENKKEKSNMNREKCLFTSHILVLTKCLHFLSSYIYSHPGFQILGPLVEMFLRNL